MKWPALTASVSGLEVFSRAYNRIKDKIEDWTEIFEAVRDDWFYPMEQSLFFSEGASGGEKWDAPTPKYEEYKAIEYPFMPIMRREDKLYKSLTRKDTLHSISNIQKQSMEVGTNLFYARLHHEGKGQLKVRKLIQVAAKNRRDLMKVIQRELVPYARAQGFRQTKIGEV